MSVPAEGAPAPEPGANEEVQVIDLAAGGDAAFSALMDALVPDPDPAPAGEGGAPADPAAAGDGSPAAGDQGAGATAQGAGAPAAGAGGGEGLPTGNPADASSAPAAQPATGAGPAAGAVDAAELTDAWGEVTEALETAYVETHRSEALAETREEYGQYFAALEQHPRLMVGQEVPSLREGGGTVTLRDAADAKEWQEAVKSILIREVQDRASRKADDVKPMMETLHGSIGLFQNNADLVPGTKQFDLDLANRFADLAKPYELRVEEKLVGYTIPVQPLVNQVRSQLAAERAARATTAAPAAPAAPATPTAQQQRAAEQQRNQVGQFANPDAPQAGIASKAGAGAADEGDFSTLFGTIGLPHLRI